MCVCMHACMHVCMYVCVRVTHHPYPHPSIRLLLPRSIINPPLLTANQQVIMYEFLQEAGETVFVPGGWWHAVINLEDSVAVTQNFASRVNFPTVWRKTRGGRKGMARKWLRLLEERYPDLAAVARKCNEVDGFRMPTAEEKAAAKRRKKREKEEKKKGKGKEKGGGSTTASASSSSSSSAVGSDAEPHKRKGESQEASEQQKRGRREEMAQ